MDEDWLDIDGSRGEGGGQILRSSLTLSLVTGRPIRLLQIRAGRERPGLQPQHLMAVEAAARVGNAAVSGATLGSRELEFRPQAVVGGVYDFQIRTAGSATLVLQTVLPALSLAREASRVIVSGGTHNPFAPPCDFLQSVYLPLFNRLGPEVTLRLERHGFYPAGGGRIVAEIKPSPVLRGFDLLERGEVGEQEVRAIVSRLPLEIAQREVATALAELNWPARSGRVEEVGSNGPGNVVWARLVAAGCSELLTEFGKRGLRAEQVARRLAASVREYLAHDAPVGEHLADQWLLPLGLAVWQSGQSHVYRAAPLSLHATTHLEILELFLGVTGEVEPSADGSTVTVRLRAGKAEARVHPQVVNH
ncbi:MAG: RNA 3'-terminal phosphate cyclase [Planctomycetota bacterium]